MKNRKKIIVSIVALFLSFGFRANNLLAHCPACLGTVGLPLKGPFLTSLTPFDLNVTYQETLETKDELWRKIRIFNISGVYNLPESNLSFGATLPFSYAEGFMADREYHRVTGFTGIDLFTRYFFIKNVFSANSAILMAILGTRLPIGTISHLEHPDVKVPPGLLTSIGGSIVISGPWVFYGNTTYLYNLKNFTQFSLGDKFLTELGVNSSLNLGLPLMLGLEFQGKVNFPDQDPADPDVAENTGRQLISIGPGVNVLIINNPKVSFGIAFQIPVWENISGTKQLPASNTLNFDFKVGF